MIRQTRLAFAASLAALAFAAGGASAAEILIHDAKSQPESLTVAPNGDVIAGSASSPYVYRVKKGASTAEVIVDASADAPGTFFFGQLADGATNTLWTCQLAPNPAGGKDARQSALRAFDLTTFKEKLRWKLPGDNTTCNDFAIGPDKALYIVDTTGAKIYRLAPGSTTPTLFLDNQVLFGVDGVAFLGKELYVTNVFFGKLYRVPMDATGKAGAPVDILLDRVAKRPDGMRAGNGKLYWAENAGGAVDSLTIKGDTAHVEVIKDGLATPTGIEPHGDTLWITERAAGKVWSLPLAK